MRRAWVETSALVGALGSVSAKTAHVVTGEEAGRKLERARKLGVSVLDEAARVALPRE